MHHNRRLAVIVPASVWVGFGPSGSALSCPAQMEQTGMRQRHRQRCQRGWAKQDPFNLAAIMGCMVAVSSAVQQPSITVPCHPNRPPQISIGGALFRVSLPTDMEKSPVVFHHARIHQKQSSQLGASRFHPEGPPVPTHGNKFSSGVMEREWAWPVRAPLVVDERTASGQRMYPCRQISARLLRCVA
ncbi:hypothetical protein EDB80DRAFT_167613 [Ilyonectria destructans]|nr:hypothetical protein EDB80DRAFT_167613 [Ilyonectria destructans]